MAKTTNRGLEAMIVGVKHITSKKGELYDVYQCTVAAKQTETVCGNLVAEIWQSRSDDFFNLPDDQIVNEGIPCTVLNAGGKFFLLDVGAE